MKKIIIFSVISVTTVIVLALFFGGCSVLNQPDSTVITITTNSTTTTTTTTTTTLTSSQVIIKGLASGQLSSSSIARIAISGNDQYTDVYLTPESYAAAFWILKISGTSGTPEYAIMDRNPLTEDPERFPLTAVASILATKGGYPPAGTYERLLPTIAYLEMTIPSDKVSPESLARFRIHGSTWQEYTKGDVQVYDTSDDTWKWVTLSSNVFTLHSTRPTTPVLSNDFNDDDNNDLYFSPTDVTFPAISIVASSDATNYEFTLAFNISNTFSFNDVNDNGIFEPTITPPVGDLSSDEENDDQWDTGKPGITLTFTSEVL